MRTDRRTDITKLIVTLCNFANAPKILHFVHSIFTYFVCIAEKKGTSNSQRSMIGLHNRGDKCLQPGRDWVFKLD